MVCGLLAGSLAWLVHSLLVLEFPYMLDYGEGAVLQLSTLMQRGEPVFRNFAEPPYLICLYAPVHPWLAGVLMGPIPTFATGRFLSVASMTLLMVAMFAYLRRRASTEAAVAGVACFLVHPLVLGWGFRNRIDMMALLASGLALFLGSLKPPSWRRDVALALLLAFAFFVKQSYVAAGAALVGVTLLQSWRAALRLAILSAGCVALGIGLMWQAFGPYFLEEMFRFNALPFVYTQMQDYFLGYLPSVGGMLVLGLVYLVRGGARRNPLWFLFCVTSLGVAIGSGRSGGFYNYFLELHLGLAVLAGLALHDLLAEPNRGLRAAVQLVAVAQLVLAGTDEISFMNAPVDFLRYETRAVMEGRYPRWLASGYDAASLQPWLDRHPGPVLAENLGNPILMGRLPWFCDPVAYRLVAQIGKFDEQTHLIQRIANREFAVILLQVTWGNLRFSPQAIGTILEHYEQVGKAGVDNVFLPKKSP